MPTKTGPASAAEARDEIRSYMADELECAPADIQAKVVFNAELPWVDGRKHTCYLVEWTARNGADGVALAGPYTHNLSELSLAAARRLGSLHEWRQQLLNLYAGCESAVRARLTHPVSEVPDPTRTKQLLASLQDPRSPRIAVNCSVREFLRVGTDEYYILNGDWVHNPHFSYSPTFGFKPRRDDTRLELPTDGPVRITPHQFLTPVPPLAEDDSFSGEPAGFIMVKDGQVVEPVSSALALARPVFDKVALYYLIGLETGPYKISL